jgi:ferric-dicitrate binding protein FerR (iron transport regulator)
MLNDQILSLIIRKLSKEASGAELRELEYLLKEYPSFQYFEEILADYWHAHGHLPGEKELSLDSHFNYILRSAEIIKTETEPYPELHSHGRIKNIWLKRSAAAAAILAIAVSLYIFEFSNKTKQANPSGQKTVILAKAGARSKIILPDGTSVWLNSGSSLGYNNSNFNDSVRYVELDGEGFFDVVKDAAHPFIVHTSRLDVKVLGTVFNVKSYSNENTIEATLLKGLIEIERKDIPQAPKIILHEHEKMIFSKQENQVSRSANRAPAAKHTGIEKFPEISIIPVSEYIPDSALTETSWIYNKLIFDGDTFRQLAVKMERWFNVKIYFLNDAPANYRFRGIFENETIEEALQALQLTASFTYKIKGDEIYIDKK